MHQVNELRGVLSRIVSDGSRDEVRETVDSGAPGRLVHLKVVRMAHQPLKCSPG
ncbi:hypothetical protein [Streptomyces sp. NPDC005525]|uniref:hypothetical protein n=1 Tax=Streptomyces sp. NPDC005525 TaxID=3364720 RepID=UPI003680A76D